MKNPIPEGAVYRVITIGHENTGRKRGEAILRELFKRDGRKRERIGFAATERPALIPGMQPEKALLGWFLPKT